ncbi:MULTISPECIES: hypothetical protein [Clostridia]|jgi:hypothetical protein|uniref:hypothetical protein n=1 Tax=Clostridia TaxID=186801 RepID=UPI0005D36D21|nr:MULTISPECIES: hypothetical protein [Clostridia]KJJ65456.1 hypothetical protein CLFS41_57220 [Clostridium sp. FS41]
MNKWFVRFGLKSGHILYGQISSENNLAEMTEELSDAIHKMAELTFWSLDKTRTITVELSEVASYEVSPWKGNDND